jgi:hypothetical protein
MWNTKKIQQLSNKITELEKKVEEKDKLISQLTLILASMRPVSDKPNLCNDGQPHRPRSPWHSITPPPCEKCGKIMYKDA